MGQEDREITVRNQQGAAEMIFHQRPKNETHQERGGFTLELNEYVAEGAERRQYVDIKGVIGDVE